MRTRLFYDYRFDDDPATVLAALASAYCLAGLGRPDLVLDMRGHGVSVLGRAAPRLAAEFRASPRVGAGRR